MSTEGFMNVVQQIVTTLCVFCFLFLVRAWWNWQSSGLRSIPSKGSFGWPIVGETLSVVRCAGDFTFELWLRERVQKFGTMFKSHIFLKPTIIVTSQEEVKFILDDPHKALVTGVPGALKRILGRSSLLVLEGKEHRNVHKLLNDSLLMPELKQKIPEFNRLIRYYLGTWDGHTVEIYRATQEMIFKVMTFNFFGIPWEDEIADEIATLLPTIMEGVIRIPIYFPGTAFYKGVNARRRLNTLLLDVIREVRSAAESGRSSKYASAEKFPYQNLLNYEINGEKISDMDVCDILLSPLLGGSDAPTSALAQVIHHLTENPSMLQKAQAEVDQVRKRKEELGETDLLVSDLKDLKYLSQVLSEVLRITTIVPGGARLATTDVHFNGYMIPKGWAVMAPVVLNHMNPELYPEPSKFDPDRFETPPNPGKFFPFGRGYRACIGRDFTKLVVLTILYHFLSTFTWDVVSCSGNYKYLPWVRMIGGFQISIKSRTDPR